MQAIARGHGEHGAALTILYILGLGLDDSFGCVVDHVYNPLQSIYLLHMPTTNDNSERANQHVQSTTTRKAQRAPKNKRTILSAWCSVCERQECKPICVL